MYYTYIYYTYIFEKKKKRNPDISDSARKEVLEWRISSDRILERKPVLLWTRARRDPRSSLGVPAETRPFPSCNPLLSVRSSSNLMHVEVHLLWHAPVSSASFNLVSSWLVSFFLSPLLSFFFSPIIGTLAGRTNQGKEGEPRISSRRLDPRQIFSTFTFDSFQYLILSTCSTRIDQARQPYFNRSREYGYRVIDCLLLGTLLTRHWMHAKRAYR